MKEKIMNIMSCNVTTTSYKLQQLNLLRGDAILAHDYESVKLIDENIESLQVVYHMRNEATFLNKASFDIVIENGVDINKEYRTREKEIQHDLFEDMENTTTPCVARAMQAVMPDVDFELEHGYDPNRELTDKQKEAAENSSSTKRAIYTKHIKKFLSKVKYLGLAPTDLKYKQLYENTYRSAYMEVYGPYGRRNKLIQRYLRNGNYVVTKHCENCPMRYNCNESDIEVPISEKLVMKNVPVDKYCRVLSRHYDSKKAAEKKAAEEEKKAEIAEAKHLAAREALKELAEKTNLGHEVNLAPIEADIINAKLVALHDAINRDTKEILACGTLEKAIKNYNKMFGTNLPVPTAHDIYSVLPDVSTREEIGFSDGSPLVITSAQGADYEAIVNSFGTKAYPLVKTIIENKVKLPEKYCKEYDIAKEMNGFDIELSGKSHKEVATILSELCERMERINTFFKNCAPAPFVDKGVVATGTKTEPAYMHHVLRMLDDCATFDDEQYAKAYEKIMSLTSVTVPVATMDDISKHQDEVMKANEAGIDTKEYQDAYYAMRKYLDKSWIENLLDNVFFDQSQPRFKRQSVDLTGDDEYEDAYKPMGTMQRKHSNREKFAKTETKATLPVHPDRGEGARVTYVSDVLDIIRRLENYRKGVAFRVRNLDMLATKMGGDWRTFYQLLAFTDIKAKLETVLVRNIGETYVVTTEKYLDMVYNKYYWSECADITAYVNCILYSKNNKHRQPMTYMEFRNGFHKNHK